MGWQKKKIDIAAIDNEIEEHKYLIKYLQVLKMYATVEMDDNQKDNVNYVIYKKYVELGNVRRVQDWLNENGYRHLGRKFTTEMVTRLIDLMVPDVSPELNFLAKSLKDENPFRKLDMWWQGWERKQFNQQLDILEWQMKPFYFALDNEMRDSANMFRADIEKAEKIYFDGDAEQKRQARVLLNNSFNRYMMPYCKKAENEVYILKE